jgi:NAD(P)-dependent dehydrogenase (short-subunit alcohol dehydrogenase family)
MKIDLSGKTAIVTGSTGGTGFAITRGLADCGATIVVNGLMQAAVDRAIAGVRAGTPKAELRGLAADLSNAAGCNALVGAEPPCDILVNNVGIMARRISLTYPQRVDAVFRTQCDVGCPPVARLHAGYA